MTNRLHLPWQLRLLLIACLFPWTSNLIAQCECGMPINNGTTQVCSGDLFTLTYSGPDTIYVGSDCMGVLSTGISSSVSFMPAPATTVQTISGGFSEGDDVPGGTVVTYQYIVSDNVTEDTLCFLIEFVDTIPPAFNTTISNASVDCGVANFTQWWEDQVDSLTLHSTDNCGISTINHSQADTLMDNCGVFVDTFFVVDDFGNTTFTVAEYSISDSEAPVFTSLPANESLSCEDAIPLVGIVSATDNCAAIITPIFLSETTIPIGVGDCANYKYEIHRTWRVTDGCGNIIDSTQIISVDDVTPPTFDVPADTVIACNTSTDTMATGNIGNVLDNCTANLTVTMSQTTVGGTCVQEMMITRTWQVTDACGNSLAKSQTISVVDTVAPVAVFPADITVDCFDSTDDSATGLPTSVSDNCHPNPTTMKQSDVITAGPCDHTFTVERTWTVTDACGNEISDIQIITVQDTIAPIIGNEAVNQTVTCDVDIAAAFNNWINMHGAGTATDNCVAPADSLEWNAYVAGTTDIAALPGPDCVNPTPGIFTTVTVDFVVSDKCDNKDTTTAIFTVADNDPPVIINCPADVTVDTDPGQCESIQTLLLPVVMENCGNTTLPVNLSISQTPTIPFGSDPVETPIDDLVYHFNVNGPPYSAVSPATLTIILEALDAEAPTEYLKVFGEDGSLLGNVANTAGQCGDTLSTFSIPASTVDAWAFDGVLTITVKPNIPASLPGRFSVNPICPNNLVTAELSYSANFPAGLGFEYSINGGTRNAVLPLAPFDEVFGQGINIVDYFFLDCAGNEATCNFELTIEDNELPIITCPSDQTINLDVGNCQKEVIVPLFTNVTDNCGVTTPSIQTQPADSLLSLIGFSFNPNLGDFVADDKTFTFSGLQGNATPGGVKLIIEIQADVDSVGEYFQIFVNGVFLGTTSNSQGYVIAGDCNTPSTATFTIPATIFNDWTGAGDIIVEAISFMSFPIPPAGPTWGINPCDPGQVTSDGDTDGSYIMATFSYESVTPTFSATGANTVDPIALTPPLEADTLLLNQGTTTFTYSVTDLAGNTGECNFDIEILDVEPPLALCGPAFVDINPSGFDVDTVFANEIDLGSMDNCTIASMTVTPNVFSCENQGTEPVVLTVTDAAGNVSTCNTFVNVTTQKPVPTAQSDCGNTFMQLFANPPASSAGNNVIYNYTWINPSGIPFSFVQDPIIQDANISDIGFYTVIIEGVTFCESMSSVQVTCDLLPLQKPVLQVGGTSVCASETIELSTAAVCGATVKYNWYTGPFPGVLMSATTQPNYSMLPPSSGNFSFYVIVERNGCESEVSEEIGVQVNAAPTATAAQGNILICEGEEVVLNSINVPQGATCHWIGPCGYESFVCSPAPINSVNACNSGTYQLVVTSNGCPSVPDTVFVNVIALPQMPFVSNTTSANNPACHGESITLIATPVFGAVAYEWTTPMFTTLTSPVNVLTVQNSDISKDAGLWTVKVIGNPCESLVSAPTTVYIEPLPEAVSSAITPTEACEGQDVQLSASSATPNVTYNWIYPNGQSSAQPNPVLNNVSAVDIGTYTLTVTTQFGCTVEGLVDLNILDRVDITGISSDVPPCASGPVTVDLLATLFPIDGGNYEYLWTGPGGFSSTNPSATIPGGTSDDNGPYTLVVTNAEGCSSLPATVDVEIPEILATPGAPVLSVSNPHCVGDAVTLTTTPFGGSNATYFWILPNNTTSTSSPTLVLNDVELDDAGNYYVHYQVDGCLSAVSGGMMLAVNPIPLISPSSNSPVCEGDIIELDIDCSAGASYEWFGPGSFGSAACNPIIVSADPTLHTGTYSVRKQVDGCWSEVNTFNIEVKEKPEMPTALNAGPFCADTEDVILSVSNNSATPGAVYTWYDINNVPLNNGTPALNFAVPNASAMGDNSFPFYVIASLDGCESTPSFTTEVTINTIPANIAEAGQDIEACQGDDIFLQGTTPSVGTGWWTSVASNPPGVTIFNPDQAGSEIEGMIPTETYIFQWTLSNGACENFSTDEMTVFVNMLEEADAGDAITVCHANTVTLVANTPVSNIGQWSQPLSQEMLGVFINTPDNPNTIITGLVPGNNYVFTWTIDGGCGSSEDAILVTVTNENAFAGIDYEDCGDGSTILDAIAPLSENGMWTSPDLNIIFATPTDPLSVAEGLQIGENILVWTIDDGDCGIFSVDSVIVDYQFAPIGVDDAASVPFAGATALNVTDNDDIPGFYTLNILELPSNGEAELDEDGEIIYQADVNFVGEDIVIYEICMEGCVCTTATVSFNVGENAECMAPSIITPNGDGMNDAFVIPCFAQADRFPVNVVSIYNQWGDEVYHAEPYQNDWYGTFNGEELPAGTYFYLIDLGSGDKPMSGYLIIQR